MTRRIHNFSAGPAALPLPVLEEVQRELVDFEGSGMSLMEMSHRGKIYDRIHFETISRLKALLGMSDDYAVLFMGGGARTQFALVAMNLLTEGKHAEYLVTGAWSEYAIKEAKKLGDAKATYSSAESGHNHVPQPGDYQVAPSAAYLHYTSNNTIFGTQYADVPKTGDVPLVCDMSSDILSRPVPIERFGLIYAGAQKNMGPAGVTVVVVRKDLLERSRAELPEMFSYAKVAAKDSLLNTPPTFAIYVTGRVLEWLQQGGGLEAMAKTNEAKARKLYEAIEGSGGFYKPHARGDSRSQMNVTFRLANEALEAKFVAEATARDLSGLKGHRSVGGIRASIYNAVPMAAVDALVGFMAEFQKSNG